MKKIKILGVFCLLVFLSSTNTNAWKAATHQEQIKVSVKYIENNVKVNNAKVKITTNQENIMITTAKLVDSDKGAGGLQELYYLHGSGRPNYVANSKFLYEVAVAYRRGDKNALTTAINKCKKNNVEYDTQMEEAVKRVVSKRLWKHYPKAAEADTPGYRSWKVMGLLHHLVGDTYAHRTIVPSSAVDGSLPTYSSSTRVGKTHFDLNKTACKYNDTELKNIFKDINARVGKAEYKYLRGNLVCLRKATKLNVVETRDMGHIDKHGPADNHFEDNEKFLAVRYTAGTRYAAKRIMYSFITRGDFSAYTFAQYYGQETSKPKPYKINGLKNAYKKAGYNVDKMGFDWNILSTTDAYV